LTYSWSSSDGIFPMERSGNEITWEAPEKEGEFPLNVVVADGQNVVSGSVSVSVEANPKLTVSPDHIDFSDHGTGTTIAIKNTGTGILTWTISVDADWLTVSQISGETATENHTEVGVEVNREGYAIGNYSGNITITSNGGSQDINITMEVPGNPSIFYTPLYIAFGTDISDSILRIQNVGTGTLDWTIVENTSWISISPTSGSTTSETDQVVISVTRDGLEPGEYISYINIDYKGGSIRINITMEVSEMSGTFIDARDGHEYKWVKIGKQIWMAENLAYLPYVSLPGDGSSTDPYCYVYNYNGADIQAAKLTSNYATYGVLYNWIAANELCPDGWHLPSDTEWEELAQYISEQKGPYSKVDDDWLDVGTHLKATSGWSNDGNGTDDYNFSALPGGMCYNDKFTYIGHYGYWWSSAEGSNSVVYWYLGSNFNTLYRFYNYKITGFSVRCVKD